MDGGARERVEEVHVYVVFVARGLGGPVFTVWGEAHTLHITQIYKS